MQLSTDERTDSLVDVVQVEQKPEAPIEVCRNSTLADRPEHCYSSRADYAPGLLPEHE